MDNIKARQHARQNRRQTRVANHKSGKDVRIARSHDRANVKLSRSAVKQTLAEHGIDATFGGEMKGMFSNIFGNQGNNPYGLSPYDYSNMDASHNMMPDLHFQQLPSDMSSPVYSTNDRPVSTVVSDLTGAGSMALDFAKNIFIPLAALAGITALAIMIYNKINAKNKAFNQVLYAQQKAKSPKQVAIIEPSKN